MVCCCSKPVMCFRPKRHQRVCKPLAEPRLSNALGIQVVNLIHPLTFHLANVQETKWIKIGTFRLTALRPWHILSVPFPNTGSPPLLAHPATEISTFMTPNSATSPAENPLHPQWNGPCLGTSPPSCPARNPDDSTDRACFWNLVESTEIHRRNKKKLRTPIVSMIQWLNDVIFHVQVCTDKTQMRDFIL